MSAILNSLNAHNFLILQPILMTLVSKFMVYRALSDKTYLLLGLRSPLSLVMRKPAFCICENKDTDQLRGNREADQRLCFRYTDTTIPLLSKFEISSL